MEDQVFDYIKAEFESNDEVFNDLNALYLDIRKVTLNGDVLPSSFLISFEAILLKLKNTK